MKRPTLTFLMLVPVLPLGACGPDYSPNTYASSAVQQAAKVDQGLVVGVRRVGVTPQGTTGALAGGAAGGALGSQVPAVSGVTATLGAIGGSLIGGLVGAGTEKAVGETQAWEYIVRKPAGELVSVTQRDETPIAVGTRVLVIAGSQARIVPDYIVPAPGTVTLPDPGPVPVPGPGPVPVPMGVPSAGTTLEPEPSRPTGTPAKE